MKIPLNAVLGHDNKYYRPLIKKGDLRVKARSGHFASGNQKMCIGLDDGIYIHNSEDDKINKFDSVYLKQQISSDNEDESHYFIEIGLDGKVYASSRKGKVLRFNPLTLEKEAESIQLNYSARAFAIGIDGSVFVYDFDNKFYKIKPDTLDAQMEIDLNNDLRINDIAIGPSGELFVGGYSPNIVRRYDPETFSSMAQSPAFSTQITCIKVGKSGNVYIGTGDGKLVKLNPDTLQIEKESNYSYTQDSGIPYDTSIFAIHEGRDGYLYVGGGDDFGIFSSDIPKFGLWKFDAETLELTDKSIGLDMIINDIREDSKGNLYVSSSSVFNSGIIKKFQPYDEIIGYLPSGGSEA